MSRESKARCYISSDEIKRVTKEQANGHRNKPAAETQPAVPMGENVPQPPVTFDFGTFAAAAENDPATQVQQQQEVAEFHPLGVVPGMCQQPVGHGTSPPQQPEKALPKRTNKNNRTPLSQEEKDQVAILISYGHSLRQAASQIGRSHMTLCRHLKKDSAFAEQVERYRGYAESDAMTEVVKASKRSWRAAAWLLTYLEKRERTNANVSSGAT